MKPPQSKRWRECVMSTNFAKRLDCGAFTAALSEARSLATVPPHSCAMKQGLVLDKVVLLGRTLDEYRRYFTLDLEGLRGRKILDVASGVSSFCAEARRAGLRVTAFDAIYELPADEIERRCATDLDHVTDAIRDLKTYRWDFYQSPENLRKFREQAYRGFLADYCAQGKACYVPGLLPKLPFRDGEFDLTLVSYLLFVYEDQLDYEFHKRSLLEIMRVTCGEARVYPIVTFEAKRSSYLDRLRSDRELQHLAFEEVRTDFEFLLNSNFYLRVSRR
ncbi:MAG: hypothetical protein FD161_3891 [Limisphaerales bacterium]|nr:MAG: hypothetical protein FD161_3891 [Limisphaerales bacterium]KAG0507341.1 MAG: hypothetical protein E1N63_3488 [Limisphaerales bacterium]TXT51652.1 MAG: hypothetical protein FD140_1456 [Limisphaerales bacterium]